MSTSVCNKSIIRDDDLYDYVEPSQICQAKTWANSSIHSTTENNNLAIANKYSHHFISQDYAAHQPMDYLESSSKSNDDYPPKWFSYPTDKNALMCITRKQRANSLHRNHRTLSDSTTLPSMSTSWHFSHSSTLLDQQQDGTFFQSIRSTSPPSYNNFNNSTRTTKQDEKANENNENEQDDDDDYNSWSAELFNNKKHVEQNKKHGHQLFHRRRHHHPHHPHNQEQNQQQQQQQAADEETKLQDQTTACGSGDADDFTTLMSFCDEDRETTDDAMLNLKALKDLLICFETEEITQAEEDIVEVCNSMSLNDKQHHNDSFSGSLLIKLQSFESEDKVGVAFPMTSTTTKLEFANIATTNNSSSWPEPLYESATTTTATATATTSSTTSTHKQDSNQSNKSCLQQSIKASMGMGSMGIVGTNKNNKFNHIRSTTFLNDFETISEKSIAVNKSSPNNNNKQNAEDDKDNNNKNKNTGDNNYKNNNNNKVKNNFQHFLMQNTNNGVELPPYALQRAGDWIGPYASLFLAEGDSDNNSAAQMRARIRQAIMVSFAKQKKSSGSLFICRGANIQELREPIVITNRANDMALNSSNRLQTASSINADGRGGGGRGAGVGNTVVVGKSRNRSNKIKKFNIHSNYNIERKAKEILDVNNNRKKNLMKKLKIARVVEESNNKSNSQSSFHLNKYLESEQDTMVLGATNNDLEDD